jgi:hypothetical protein
LVAQYIRGQPSLYRRWRSCQVPVAHACNPSTQVAEIRRIEVPIQPQANSLRDPILGKKIQHKTGLVEWLMRQKHLPSKREALS